MEARFYRFVILTAALGSLGASYRTPNFVVEAPTPQIAQQIGQAAEKYRQQLAVEWLGQEMRTWGQPCPITAHVGDQLGAGGATSFLFERGEVYGWRMTIQGSLVRILDSVLPHEVTHTIFATHFRQPLPRWADEGACTTVEHYSERAKQQTMLVDFLRTGRGIPFSRMFAMKEYPHDVMPLYSQGHSLACYLIAQGGKRRFLTYLADGMKDENWTQTTHEFYGFENLAVLQNSWLDWVRQGSPAIRTRQPASTPATLASTAQRTRPTPNLIYRGQSADPESAPSARPSRLENAARGDAPEASVYSEARQQERLAGSPAPAAQWHPPVDDADRSRPRERLSEEPAATPVVTAPASRETASSSPTLVPPAAETPPSAVAGPQATQRSRQIILEWSRPEGR